MAGNLKPGHIRGDESATGEWSVQNFYDQMAETYYETAELFERVIQSEKAVLQKLLAESLGDGALQVLDCACGVGTQLLGFAEYGHHVTGSDFCPSAIRRARREAAARELSVTLDIADMRALPYPSGRFDAIVCADNSIPHLLTRDAMVCAVTEMCRVLRPGGLVIITVRDYDSLREKRVSGTRPFIVPTKHGRVIILQVWSWHPDGERYDVEEFRLIPDAPESVRLTRFATRFWAVSRAQLSEVLTDAGLTEVRWHECDDTGYHQPIVTARRPD